MNEYAELGGNGKKTMLPLIEGTAGERAIDISKLRDQTGLITLDSGYGNTGSCQSAITFIDGEKGILRYRGIPIEELAEQSTFIETALLIIYGKLPTDAELRRFSDLLTKYELIHEDMKFHFEGFPPNAHPMAILSSMINAAGCYYPSSLRRRRRKTSARRLPLSSLKFAPAACAYRRSRGLPIIYPKPQNTYSANFLHMMFSVPDADYEVSADEALKRLIQGNARFVTGQMTYVAPEHVASARRAVAKGQTPFAVIVGFTRRTRDLIRSRPG
jgi:citrate synthase